MNINRERELAAYHRSFFKSTNATPEQAVALRRAASRLRLALERAQSSRKDADRQARPIRLEHGRIMIICERAGFVPRFYLRPCAGVLEIDRKENHSEPGGFSPYSFFVPDF